MQAEKGKGRGGRNKWKPAALTAYHVCKSLYDLRKKTAKTNNGTFSIIYNSDVLWWAARVRCMFCIFCVRLFTSSRSHMCFSALPRLNHWYQWGGDVSSPGNNKGAVNFFVPSRLVAYYLLFVSEFLKHAQSCPSRLSFFSLSSSIFRLSRMPHFGLPPREWDQNNIHHIMDHCI